MLCMCVAARNIHRINTYVSFRSKNQQQFHLFRYTRAYAKAATDGYRVELYQAAANTFTVIMVGTPLQ